MPRRSAGAGLALVIGLACLAAAGCDRSTVVSPAATLSVSAGTIDVQCIGRTRIKVLGAQPAAGYGVEIIVAGPTHQASLRFTNPAANDYKIFLQCSDGVPSLTESEIEDTTLTP